jgi:RNA recognition motif-containing protein
LTVGNIPWQTAQEELQELFSRVGEARFELHREKGSNKPSGYGFVDFKDPQAASMAIQKFNGYDLGGRELNVSYPSQSAQKSGGGASSSSAPKASGFAQAKARDIQRQRTSPIATYAFYLWTGLYSSLELI